MSLVLESGLGVDGGRQELLELPVDGLVVGEGVRSRGLDGDHVALLMELGGEWHPIVVWGEECLVVDGAHRVAAARRLGHERIAAVRFVGSREEAFLESVRRNVDHGLPLTVTDRRRAATRVLARHPDWSDRRIASVCGLSGKTVARMRCEPSLGGGDCRVVGRPERRVGRDGKARPVQAGEVRDRIRVVLEENPGASLRLLASLAGASPETVRTVRAERARRDRAVVEAGGSPIADIVRLGGQGVVGEVDERVSSVGHREGVASGVGSWDCDRALLTCGDGGDFARWFTRSRVDEDWHDYVWTVPVGRIYEVVDEARRRATMWNEFASILESRTHRRDENPKHGFGRVALA